MSRMTTSTGDAGQLGWAARKCSAEKQPSTNRIRCLASTHHDCTATWIASWLSTTATASRARSSMGGGIGSRGPARPGATILAALLARQREEGTHAGNDHGLLQTHQ